MSVSLLEMSLMGGGMVLLTLLIKYLARNRLPHGVTAFMWGLTLLRLTLPFSIPSPVSLLGLIQGAPQAQAAAAPVWQSTAQPIPFQAGHVFLLGTAVCALLFLAAILRQKRVLDTALPAPLTQELKNILALQRLSRPVGVYTSDRISTPLVYGLARHRIVLPAGANISGEALYYVITHECVHIKRHDALKKLLLMLVVCLHWFNPLIWLMAAAVRRDMELGCDKKVLALCGFSARASYARTLLSLEGGKRFSGILMDHFSRSPLEMRIRSIMTVKKTALPGILAAVLAYGLVSMLLIASPQAQETISVQAMRLPIMGSIAWQQPAQNVIYTWEDGTLTVTQPSGIAVSTADVAAVGGLFTPAHSSVRVIRVYGNAPLISGAQGAGYAFYTAQAAPATVSLYGEIQP